MRAKHRAVIFGWVLLIGVGIVAIACSPSPTPRPEPVSPTIVPLLPSPTGTSTEPSQAMKQTPTLTKTPRPTRTPTEPPAETYTPSPEPSPMPPGAPTSTPSIGGVDDAPPPFDITLPPEWDEQYNQLGVLRPGGETMDVKIAFYSGPIGDGLHEAVVLVLWDYPMINEDVWKDGVELVGVVFDPSCQFNMIGAPPTAQTYLIGIHYAEGIPFEVEACRSPSDPDVTGWLVGYRRAETNYLLYVRIAPPDGSEEAADYVQSILETIRFPGES